MEQKKFEDLKDVLNEWIRLDYILPEDIPSIELYMDQITTFMEKGLRGNKRNEDDKILTKTMINNYSKNNLLPPSNKKKYSKDHIILLIYIYYLKNFLSINDIQNLLKPMNEQHFGQDVNMTLSEIYSHIFQLEREYGVKIQESVQYIYETACQQYEDDNDYLKTFSMILLLSYDIYAKKQLVEKLIDSMAQPIDSKAEKKEAKEREKKAKENARKKQK
ncbi:MAG: DUF1836 domain-containing protein [Lachnospiraceae bacterium]|nr:DUF1836 domain-containing protein [Lachnospiraceae bacterium]